MGTREFDKALSTSILPKLFEGGIRASATYRAGLQSLEAAFYTNVKVLQDQCIMTQKYFSPTSPSYMFSDESWITPGKTKGTVYHARASEAWWRDTANLHSWVVRKGTKEPCRPTDNVDDCEIKPDAIDKKNQPPCVARSCYKEAKGFKKVNWLKYPWFATGVCGWLSKNECPMVPTSISGGDVKFKPGVDTKGLECMAKFEITVMKCSTCCCKKGILNYGVSSDLIWDKRIGCRTWMAALADVMERVKMLLFNAGVHAIDLSVPCYERGGKDEEVGEAEAVGRRAGGFSAQGTVTLSAGGNRAGNDEALA